VIGGVLLVMRGRDHPFPFGPSVAGGALIVALAAL
jgi:hypothetical protein